MKGFRSALMQKKPLIGSWIQTGSPAAAEILAGAGFDWIAVDCEHSSIGIEEFTQAARGLHGRDVTALARVRENDTLAIRQALDMGAEGVIVPMVNSAEEAKKAVAAAKYPPLGRRGFGYCRANNWGMDFDAYAARANEDVSVIVMIESREAVEQIDAILEVEGVDGVFVGPYDMSGSYGCVGKTDDPVIAKACQIVAEACERHRKAAGRHIVQPSREAVSQALEQGFTFIALGADIVFLANASREAMRYVKR
ncbi:MAG TPA: aldolase/citrate lyase family protein [Feifaniaceae bacterium]|nr:aldolase/citrate lyase family protein [Feifaniaceae bacterium]